MDHPIALMFQWDPVVVDNIRRRASKIIETNPTGKPLPLGTPMKRRLWMFGDMFGPMWWEYRQSRADRYWPLDDDVNANKKVQMWLMPGSPSVTLTWNQPSGNAHRGNLSGEPLGKFSWDHLWRTSFGFP